MEKTNLEKPSIRDPPWIDSRGDSFLIRIDDDKETFQKIYHSLEELRFMEDSKT